MLDVLAYMLLYYLVKFVSKTYAHFIKTIETQKKMQLKYGWK